MLKSRTASCLIAAIALVGGLAVAAPASSLPGVPTVRIPCDALDPAQCLLPFPNDRFTKVDASTETGRRVDFQLAEMPRNVAGKPIDPTEWNRNDGFSPGSAAMTFVPGIDIHRTWGTQNLSNGSRNDPADHIADIARYEAADAPILLINARTGQRAPFWSELDTNAFTSAGERLLIIRPATNLTAGDRYVVALRNMKDASGSVIPASSLFAAYRDGRPVPTGADELRRASVNSNISTVESAERARGNSFNRHDLYLAWDFTVASDRNITERVLHIRDDAFAQLGDTNLADSRVDGVAPRFTITSVTARTDGARQREIRGTITVPNYLDKAPMPVADSINGLPGQTVPGGRFLYGPDGLPRQNPVDPTLEAQFVCTIPSGASASNPASTYLYGHGLLGSRNESTGGSTDRMRERNFAPCATDWIGMADEDIANVLAILADPSNFPSLADRAQQGFLNFLYLGRAIANAGGFASNAAFQDGSGNPLIRSQGLVYDGNSQGGIMGGALTALAPDFTRATLGVVGMNYSTLLNRSSDWEGALVNPAKPGLPAYSSFLYSGFPDKQQQQIVMGLLQMLWDRAEANGYAARMTSNPLPNTPAHQVLMHVAFGDFQVSNHSAEVEARTIGARVMDTALMPGRHWSPTYFGLASFPRNGDGSIAPWNGSALVYWDSGNYPAPNGNQPPVTDGGDPHEDPRRDPRGGDQKATFFNTGLITDTLNGGPYLLCRPGAQSSIPRVPSQFNFDWCV